MVLGLEKAVRISDMDHHLKNEYAQSDGLRLMKKHTMKPLIGLCFL